MSNHAKPTKIMPLSEAISTHIKDGNSVCLANFASPVANSAIHEIARQGKKDLTVVIASSYFEVDVLAAAATVDGSLCHVPHLFRCVPHLRG